MNRRRFISLTAGAGAGWLATRAGAPSKDLQKFERKSRALGAEISLTIYHADPTAARHAADEAFCALDRIEGVMSLFRPASDICRLNRNGWLDRPHLDLVHVLGSALDWSRLTGGAFDPTVQPLWDLYAARRRDSQLPAPADVEATRRLVDWCRCEVRPGSIRLGPGRSITLNGSSLITGTGST